MTSHTDAAVGTSLRTMIREELEAILGPGGTRLADRSQPAAQAPSTRALQTSPEFDGLGLEHYAEHVLREAGGGPMSCHDMAERIYAMGFSHRWPPKYPDQLVRSLNALASPSQHPDKFERVRPRVLKLR